MARGFYTALADALLSSQKLPNLDAAQAGANSASASSANKSMQFSLIQRLRGTRELRTGRSSSSSGGQSKSSSSLTRSARDASRSLSYDARPFNMTGKPRCFSLKFRSVHA